MATLLAVVLLGESFELYHLVGLVVIVLGLYLATTRTDLLRPMISKIIAGLR